MVKMDRKYGCYVGDLWECEVITYSHVSEYY